MDSIFSTSSYATRPMAELDFKPWHKPRKQAIRDWQWGNEVEWLLTRKPEGDKTLRYLGLPGPDLLDIRYLYDRFCRDGSRSLTFLGLDRSARAGSRDGVNLNTSLREVHGLDHVDSQSDVIGDDFNLLGNRQSIAWNMATRLGPFDAVNIDLTGHVAHDDPSISASMYNAIHQLCGLQEKRVHPWALFLSSRITRDGFSQEATKKLLDAIQVNLAECTPFAIALADTLAIADASTTEAAIWNDSMFFNAMTIGVAKWLLGLAVSMRAKFKVSSTIGYRVNAGSQHFDMLSIVLRFEPVIAIPPDSHGLASATPAFLTECEQAEKLPGRVSRIRDVDHALASDTELRDRYINESAVLLEQARYNPDRYRQWLTGDSS
jgi:hypothetical protein